MASPIKTADMHGYSPMKNQQLDNHRQAKRRSTIYFDDQIDENDFRLTRLPPLEIPQETHTVQVLFDEPTTPPAQQLPEPTTSPIEPAKYNCSQMIACIALVAMVGIIAVSITALAGGIPLSPLHATWMFSGATLLMIPLVWISINKGNRCA